MKRTDRRRFESEFKSILKKSGDNCSLCKVNLHHNSKTFGGLTHDGRTALAGECCKDRLVVVLREGVYLTKNFNCIPNFSDHPLKDEKTISPSQAVKSIHSHFDNLEKISSSLMARAGIASSRHEVCVSENPWKSDDAEWFKNNPSRSHRLRKVFTGELETIPKDIVQRKVPDGYCLDMLIKQVSPGNRMRCPVWLNSAIEVPDVEEVVHAIFDAAMKRREGGEITVDEIMQMTNKYSSPKIIN